MYIMICIYLSLPTNSLVIADDEDEEGEFRS